MDQKTKDELRPTLQELERMRKKDGDVYIAMLDTFDRIIALTRESASVRDILNTLADWRNEIHRDKQKMDREKEEIIRKYNEIMQ